MNASFAQNQRLRHAPRLILMLVIAITLAACTTLPPPTSELAAADAAVTRATAADADQYAGDAILVARDALTRAQAAMAGGDDDRARKLALAAAATADLAHARSVAAQTDSALAQQRAEVAALRQRVGLEAQAQPRPLPSLPPAAVDASPGALVQRLAALDADLQLQGMAAYERLRARQALDTLMAASSRVREDALYLARRRVEIAEIAARTDAVRQRIGALQQQRSQLLVQASRQEAERARREAERLRVQAMIQAEETARLRQAAQADSAALDAAEGVIQDVAGEQMAKLKAARARQAELARKEAELLRAAEQAEQEARALEADADEGGSPPR